jgi:hypothetical protein
VSFRLVDSGWGDLFTTALNGDTSKLQVVCPFIKRRAVERLLASQPNSIQVITRFNLNEFAQGVSDLSALKVLLDAGAEIRGVKNLHAKIYLFGDSRAIVTSANLTQAALERNHEFGFVAEDKEIIQSCRTYFQGLWNKGGQSLTIDRLAEWEELVTNYLATTACPSTPTGLGDEGADAGLQPEPIGLPPAVSDSGQAFVKFFGESTNRAPRSLTLLEELRSSGSHWACTYPRGKRPRRVRDGAVMFMGKLVKEPNDILIYGQAIALAHVQGRDDATDADIKLRPWKATWPHYVRVHQARFVAGSLGNGVSMNQMMEILQSDTFRSTRENAEKGLGNIDPRKAYLQQPAVELTAAGKGWLEEHLQIAIEKYGVVPPADMETLDWPAIVMVNS